MGVSSSVATESDSRSGRKTTQERLIEIQYEEVYKRRQEVNRKRQLDGAVDRQTRMRLQAALIDYYYLLYPFRDEQVISDWWDDVILSEQWVKDTRVEQRVEGNPMDGLSIVEEPVNVYYRGLDTIQEIENMTTTKTRVESGMMGRREYTETVPLYLDADVLIDISSKLDIATKKLGFSPEIGVQEVTDPEPV